MSNYQFMRPLSKSEYEELKADIAQRGVMVPIEFDEHGNVLDGHHRLQICHELGITNYPKVIRAGMSEAQKVEHSEKLNSARRQMTAEDMRLMREKARKAIAKSPEKSDRLLGKELGVSHKVIGRVRKEMEQSGQVGQCPTSTGADGKQYPRQVERKTPEPTKAAEPIFDDEDEWEEPKRDYAAIISKPTEEIDDRPRKPVTIFNPTRREEKAIQNPDVVKRMADTGTNVLTAEKQLHREEKADRKSFTLEREMPEGMCTLYKADIRDGLPMVEANSVDYIITDPPYPKEYIPLYGDLSRLASSVLKPGGSLIVMCGQSYLPQVIQELCKSMNYHWCMAYMTPGGQSPQLFHKKVNTFWKPVLWFVKGEYSGDYVGDVLKSDTNDNDKRFHEWGQSYSGMADIVKRFTNPGDVILDPFLGGGTTGVAAVTLGRRFIGADIEQSNVDIASDRIKKEYENARSKT